MTEPALRQTARRRRLQWSALGCEIRTKPNGSPERNKLEVDMARRWMARVVLMAAVGPSLATSALPGHRRVAYPGSQGCQQGCDFVAGGWPFRSLVDHPGISPFGSVSLTDGLLGADIIRPDAIA